MANRLPKGIEVSLGVRQTDTLVQHDPLDPDFAGLLPVAGKLPPATRYAPVARWAGEYEVPIAVPSGRA